MKLAKKRRDIFVEEGAKSLLYAVIEAAVNDVYSLKRRGVIKEGHVSIKKWPVKSDGYAVPYENFYRSPATVNELIWFFKSGKVQRILTCLHSEIDSSAMMHKLGI